MTVGRTGLSGMDECGVLVTEDGREEEEGVFILYHRPALLCMAHSGQLPGIGAVPEVLTGPEAWALRATSRARTLHRCRPYPNTTSLDPRPVMARDCKKGWGETKSSDAFLLLVLAATPTKGLTVSGAGREAW
jgi:hypothetical protein